MLHTVWIMWQQASIEVKVPRLADAQQVSGATIKKNLLAVMSASTRRYLAVFSQMSDTCPSDRRPVVIMTILDSPGDRAGPVARRAAPSRPLITLPIYRRSTRRRISLTMLYSGMLIVALVQTAGVRRSASAVTILIRNKWPQPQNRPRTTSANLFGRSLSCWVVLTETTHRVTSTVTVRSRPFCMYRPKSIGLTPCDLCWYFSNAWRFLCEILQNC